MIYNYVENTCGKMDSRERLITDCNGKDPGLTSVSTKFNPNDADVLYGKYIEGTWYWFSYHDYETAKYDPRYGMFSHLKGTPYGMLTLDKRNNDYENTVKKYGHLIAIYDGEHTLQMYVKHADGTYTN